MAQVVRKGIRGV
ncbi:hypothetical protein GQ607_005981 [Colletotrichum asianum]|uniref:Uncharacterized protein n=1 Tax=Colletotrichum asianum TaxID=702518 RepID=A0A8H3WF97_9PEZI|nr:hypothetical protein GQ607_005981 [Colletotrichum asianum]